MAFTTRDVQARCAALGFDPGKIDGMNGPKTRQAINLALRSVGGLETSDLFHDSGLHSIIWHWTAGAYSVIELERNHYNAIIDENGNSHDGKYRPEAQARYAPGRAASHTLNANTGRIGVSMDCMAGAREHPFVAGSYPMTWKQVHGLVRQTAQWCRDYDIPVSRYSTLSHAEVEQTLGIKQRNKWDVSWLPDMKKPAHSIIVGDRLREMVRDLLE